MITVSLDVRIGNVFVFTAIWVRIYNWHFRAFCNFFRAIRSPPPQVRGCPYAYVYTPHFPHSAFSTPRIFQTLPFLHPAFSTPCIFYTPHFPHFALSTLRIFYTQHFSLHSGFSTLLTQRFPPNHNNCKQLRQFIPLPDHYFTVCVLRHIEACIGYQSLMKGVNGDQLLRQTFHVVFLSLSFVHAWSCVFKYS